MECQAKDMKILENHYKLDQDREQLWGPICGYFALSLSTTV